MSLLFYEFKVQEEGNECTQQKGWNAIQKYKNVYLELEKMK